MVSGRSRRLARATVVACAVSVGALACRTSDDDPTGDAEYSYPGCNYAGESCSEFSTLECAVRTLATQYQACTRAEDCRFVYLDRSCVPSFYTNSTGCPPLVVATAGADEFRVKADEELDRFCAPDAGRCLGIGDCFGRPSIRIACLNGHCGWNECSDDAGCDWPPPIGDD